MSDILLSLVAFGKNDNYMGGFLYRFTTAMTLTIQAIINAGFADQVEIVFVDWGGETPLQEVFPTDGQVLRYIIVPPDVAEKANGESMFAASNALNVGLRRARGRYVAHTNADVVHTESFFRSIMPLLKKGQYKDIDLRTAFCAIPLKHVPIEVVDREPSIETLDDYLTTQGDNLPFQQIMPVLYGASGMLLLSRESWHRLRGMDENIIHWGWGDIDFSFRASLLGARMRFDHQSGIYVYHLAHRSPPTDPQQKRKTAPHYFNPVTVNDIDWGQGKHLFSEIPARPAAELSAELAFSVPPVSPVSFYKLRYLATILKEMIENAEPNTIANGWAALNVLKKDFFRRTL